MDQSPLSMRATEECRICNRNFVISSHLVFSQFQFKWDHYPNDESVQLNLLACSVCAAGGLDSTKNLWELFECLLLLSHLDSSENTQTKDILGARTEMAHSTCLCFVFCHGKLWFTLVQKLKCTSVILEFVLHKTLNWSVSCYCRQWIKL